MKTFQDKFNVYKLSLVLKQQLDILGISQRELAKRSGVGQSTLSNWVNGKGCPNMNNFIKLSLAFNMDPAVLMYKVYHYGEPDKGTV